MRQNGRPVEYMIRKLSRQIERYYKKSNKAYEKKHNIIGVRYLNLATKLEQKLSQIMIAKEYGATRTKG